ncbi:MAG: hypothetical protein WC279_02695 [Sulfurimonas sp.]|jgi:uncharacterized oligopeptide transporter (OPT) family protein|uniref:hypothetical protein n=1 Tax=Sulfurimonas sp. TaxID=2022749 RepID=UPI003567FD42
MKIKQMFLFVGYMVLIAFLMKPIEAILASLGYPPDSNTSGVVQIVIVLSVMLFFAVKKQQKEEKEYEQNIEKQLRTEQKIREKLEREASFKNKK